MRLARGSGILLHPTSLPGPHGSGDLGAPAHEFLAWLERSGQRYWQMLPLGPPGFGNSPYSALSAFAASPLLISLEDLPHRGWLTEEEVAQAPAFPAGRVDFALTCSFRLRLLRRAAERFFERPGVGGTDAFEEYVRREAAWLDDYALFMALHDHYAGAEWTTWDRDVARREPAALKAARARFGAEIRFRGFTQWVFAEQWGRLRQAAAHRHIRLIGDIPIFVAHHSADVWAHPELFHLDDDGRPTVVAGVPPDYFSVTGQRWGNPLYRWERMAQDGYRWWVERFRAVFQQVDVARIDHFRGFAGYWEIPEEEETAVHGQWKPGPGAQFFDTICGEVGSLPLIAEDLGLVTPDVLELRDHFHFPGMKVLQFAFGGGADNPFLPHNYDRNALVYTGTHDNDTTRGWFMGLPEEEKHRVRRYLGTDGRDVAWDLIRLAMGSVADVAIIPLADVLDLGTEGRMNRPGQTDGNWDWRFAANELYAGSEQRLFELATLYGRLLP